LTSVLGVDLDPDAEYAAREADLFDTTEIASVQEFVAAVEGMAVGTGVAGQGAELQAVLDRLPKRNHAMGVGKTKRNHDVHKLSQDGIVCPLYE
jgi:hypothetical protein